MYIYIYIYIHIHIHIHKYTYIYIYRLGRLAHLVHEELLLLGELLRLHKRRLVLETYTRKEMHG